MLITIDGPDFAGKSTIISGLRDKLVADGYVVIVSRTSLSSWTARLVEFAQEEGRSDAIKAWVFHLAYVFDLFWRGPKDKIWLQETFWTRVLAYDVAKGRPLGMAFFKTISWLLPKPTLSIFIDARMDVREARFRNSCGPVDRRDVQRFEAGRSEYRRLIAAYKLFAVRNGATIVKNNDDDDGTVIDYIMEIIKKYAVTRYKN